MGKTVKIMSQFFDKEKSGDLFLKMLDKARKQKSAIVYVNSLDEVFDKHQKGGYELTDGKKRYYTIMWRNNERRYISLPSGLYIKNNN